MVKRTKANEKAEAEYRRVRRNAKAKVGRWRRSGMSVGNVSPDFSWPDFSNTREVKKATKKLQAFNSRSNQYIAGRGGNPLPKEKVQYAKELFKKADKVNKKWHEIYGKVQVFTADGVEMGFNVNMRSALFESGGLFGRRIHSWKLNPEKLTNKELDKKIETLEFMLSPDYEKWIVDSMKKNLVNGIKTVDPILAEEISNLSDERILALHHFGAFAQSLAEYYKMMTTKGDENEDNFLEAFTTRDLELLNKLRTQIYNMIGHSKFYEGIMKTNEPTWKKYQKKVVFPKITARAKEYRKIMRKVKSFNRGLKTAKTHRVRTNYKGHK